MWVRHPFYTLGTSSLLSAFLSCPPIQLFSKQKEKLFLTEEYEPYLPYWKFCKGHLLFFLSSKKKKKKRKRKERKLRFQKGRNISELACSASRVVTSFRLACKLFRGKFLSPPRPRYSELFDSLREIIIKKRDINNSLCSVVHRNK